MTTRRRYTYYNRQVEEELQRVYVRLQGAAAAARADCGAAAECIRRMGGASMPRRRSAAYLAQLAADVAETMLASGRRDMATLRVSNCRATLGSLKGYLAAAQGAAERATLCLAVVRGEAAADAIPALCPLSVPPLEAEPAPLPR